MKTINVKILADVNLLNNYRVEIVKIHLSTVSKKQFEDSNGNLWFSEELTDLEHFI